MRAPRRGAATAELALLLPLLMFLFLVSIDFARVFYYSQTVENCARNGAIYASNTMNGSTWLGSGSNYAAVKQATLADASNLNPPIDPNNISVSTTTTGGNQVVTVTINYTFPLGTNYSLPPLFTIGNQVAFTRSVQMRVAPQSPN
jgi:Flp pilus assembly protein TadG